MVVAVAAALHEGSRAIICASTGNTSASAAAYGGRFGLRTVVVVPHGNIASGKLVQARVHGATVVSVRAGFDVALRIVRELCEHHAVTLVNSVNPNRIEGQKTAAFEIVDERRLVHERAARAIHEDRALLHGRELRGADEVLRLRAARRVERYDVGLREQLAAMAEPPLGSPA